MAKAKPQTELPKRLTTTDVAALLGVTAMAVYNYRHGSCASKTQLPSHTEPRGTRHSIYFKRHEVLQWAKKNGFQISH